MTNRYKCLFTNQTKLLTLVCLFSILGLSQVVGVSINTTIDASQSAIPVNYERHDPILISSNIDFVNQGWPGNGTKEEPYMIEYLEILGLGGPAILIHDTTAHFTIRNCHLFGGSQGLELWRVINGKIENNTFDSNSAKHIFIGQSANTTICRNNVFEDSPSYSAPGIFIIDSINITTSNNVISVKYGNGIHLWTVNNSRVSDNNVSNNEHDIGICIFDSNFVLISNNIVNDNHHGIIVRTNTIVSEISIINNTCMYNRYFGIELGSEFRVQNSFIVNNTIGWNGINVQDDGLYNAWDDGIAFGNLYGDYTGEEEVYKIYGSAGSIDYYPRKADITSPIIDSEDLIYESGFTGNSIYWYVTELHPDSFFVEKDGVLNYTGDSYTSIIEFSVDGLSLDVHNFTLIIYDTCGNNATDSVLVTVVDTISPLLDSPRDIEYVFGETGNRIIWMVFDFNPDIYELYINGSLHESTTWTGILITIDIDGLLVEPYNYTLLIKDISGNAAIDTVIVTVSEVMTIITDTTTINMTNTTSTITTSNGLPISFLIELGLGVSGIGIGIIIIIVLKKRRDLYCNAKD